MRSAGCTLVYDADCGPCRFFRDADGVLDVRHRMTFLPLDRADETGLLDEMPVELRFKSFHLLLPSREALSGAEALPELIRLFPGGTVASKLMTGAPGGRWALTSVYSVLSRLHEVGSCKAS